MSWQDVERLDAEARAAVGRKPKIEVSPAQLLGLITELRLVQERYIRLLDALREQEDE